MTHFKKLILAMTVLGASAVVHAADDNFASLTLGQTSDKVKKSSLLNSNLDHPNENRRRTRRYWREAFGKKGRGHISAYWLWRRGPQRDSRILGRV